MKKYFHEFQEKRAISQQTKRLRKFQARASEHHDVRPFYRVTSITSLTPGEFHVVICCLVFGMLTLISQCICGSFPLICSLCCRYTWPSIFFLDYLSNRTSHWNVSAVYNKFIFLCTHALWIKVKVGRITKNTVSRAQFTSGNLGC